MTKLTRKKKEIVEELMKDTVFDATSRIIEEKGWNGLTMERVAEKAEVSKGTLYNYFRDKKELVWLVMTRFITETEIRIKKNIEKHKDPTEALKQVIKEELYFRKEKSFMVLAFMQAFQEEPKLRERFSEEIHPLNSIRKAITDLFQKGMSEGKFRKMDPAALSSLLSSILMGTSRDWTYGIIDNSPEEMTEIVFSLFKQGLLTTGEDFR
jgi:AcrR family transcriptional regulator